MLYVGSLIRDCRQILPLTLSEFKRINCYFPRNRQKTYGFVMILGEIDVD